MKQEDLPFEGNGVDTSTLSKSWDEHFSKLYPLSVKAIEEYGSFYRQILIIYVAVLSFLSTIGNPQDKCNIVIVFYIIALCLLGISIMLTMVVLYQLAKTHDNNYKLHNDNYNKAIEENRMPNCSFINPTNYCRRLRFVCNISLIVTIASVICYGVVRVL